jgi:signal peptidase I
VTTTHHDLPDNDDEAVAELRRAARAFVLAHDQDVRRLPGSVLARARRRRRVYRVGGAALAGLSVAGSVGAVTLGGGPFYDYRQPSAAMSPTVPTGALVVANRDLSPARGDVVQLTLRIEGADVDGLLRVVGLPGDVVECPPTTAGTCDGVTVNGIAVDEGDYGDPTTAPFAAVNVPDGHAFLLGDARDVAIDSRLTGPTDLDDVTGVAVAVFGNNGTVQPVPGAPAHPIPDDYEVDPAEPVPPASTEDPN